MIPKRKLIKKRYTAPTNSEVTNDELSLDNLYEQLQSSDPKIKMDAIAALANLQQFDQQILIPSVLIDIVKVLYEADSSLVHSCLFAIANICQIRPVPTIAQLFEYGLDKALIQVNSSDPNLVKPIIILMTVISNNIPPKYSFLVSGIQNMIVTGSLPTTQHKKDINSDLSNPFTNPEYSDIVLQFLMRTQYSFQNSENPPNQAAIVNTLIIIAETHKSFKYRAMAARILVSLTKANTPEHIQIFTSLAEEMLCDLDLQKQFDTNLSLNIQEKQGEIMQQNNEEMEMGQQMDEQINKDNKKKEKNSNKKVMYDADVYAHWMDTVEGLQTIFQLIKEVLQNENNFQDDGQDEEDDDGDDEQMGEDEQKNNDEWSHAIVDAVLLNVLNSCKNYEKFIRLNFVEGQTIIELILNIILSLPKAFFANNPTTIDYFVYLAENCLISIFQNQMKVRHKFPVEYLSINTNLCLQIILKFKKISQRSVYVELPTLSYAQGDKILSTKHIWKEFWLSLMQIYSIFFNPQKNPVTHEENIVIGNVLKHLILNIPEMQLQEWRAQVIDTVFDVYSNQNFDKTFMELGFVNILAQIMKKAKPAKQKGKKKGEKKNKFVTDVLTDMGRFLEYKKKMIGF